jgi:hypothetical protein
MKIKKEEKEGRERTIKYDDLGAKTCQIDHVTIAPRPILGTALLTHHWHSALLSYEMNTVDTVCQTACTSSAIHSIHSMHSMHSTCTQPQFHLCILQHNSPWAKVGQMLGEISHLRHHAQGGIAMIQTFYLVQDYLGQTFAGMTTNY